MELLDEDDDFHRARKKLKGKEKKVQSELDRYLSEDCEENVDFDNIGWWKKESTPKRFPVLAKMARDILAIPMSTVASESAFNTSGRILDAFRSSLSPKICQALICAQDWMCTDDKPIQVEEDLAKLEMLEKGGHEFCCAKSATLADREVEELTSTIHFSNCISSSCTVAADSIHKQHGPLSKLCGSIFSVGVSNVLIRHMMPFN